MKCPKCCDDKRLYRNAEVRWMPDLGDWQLVYVDYTVECTHCDHQFDYEEADDEKV
jgi:hypothetical protein